MKNIAAALIKAKANFPAIFKGRINPHFKSKYAALDAILEAIDAPLGEAGILLVQPTIIRDGITILSTQLIHAESGESIESELILPVITDPQKLGSAMTYYRRFSICSILAIAPEDDDDGNTAASNIKSAQPAHSVVQSSSIAAQQAALKKAFDILNWEATRKSEWVKTISPLPITEWGNSEYALADKRAWTEVHKANSVEAA